MTLLFSEVIQLTFCPISMPSIKIVLVLRVIVSAPTFAQPYFKFVIHSILFLMIILFVENNIIAPIIRFSFSECDVINLIYKDSYLPVDTICLSTMRTRTYIVSRVSKVFSV